MESVPGAESVLESVPGAESVLESVPGAESVLESVPGAESVLELVSVSGLGRVSGLWGPCYRRRKLRVRVTAEP